MSIYCSASLPPVSYVKTGDLQRFQYVFTEWTELETIYVSVNNRLFPHYEISEGKEGKNSFPDENLLEKRAHIISPLGSLEPTFLDNQDAKVHRLYFQYNPVKKEGSFAELVKLLSGKYQSVFTRLESYKKRFDAFNEEMKKFQQTSKQVSSFRAHQKQSQWSSFTEVSWRSLGFKGASKIEEPVPEEEKQLDAFLEKYIKHSHSRQMLKEYLSLRKDLHEFFYGENALTAISRSVYELSRAYQDLLGEKLKLLLLDVAEKVRSFLEKMDSKLSIPSSIADVFAEKRSDLLEKWEIIDEKLGKSPVVTIEMADFRAEEKDGKIE